MTFAYIVSHILAYVTRSLERPTGVHVVLCKEHHSYVYYRVFYLARMVIIALYSRYLSV